MAKYLVVANQGDEITIGDSFFKQTFKSGTYMYNDQIAADFPRNFIRMPDEVLPKEFKQIPKVILENKVEEPKKEKVIVQPTEKPKKAKTGGRVKGQLTKKQKAALKA